MDYFPLIKRCRTLVFIAALLAGCDSPQSIFSSLALINSGKEFPYTQDRLALCQKTEDEFCLQAYQQVKKAKKSLFSKSREQALQLTLDTISKECAKQQKRLEEDLACSGAITALYFFSSKNDDNSIRSFLKTTSQAALQIVVSNGNMWLSNREDKAAWQELIAKSPLSAEDKKISLIYLDMEPQENQTINHLDDSV
ncbi:MAG: hypothetical protein AMJ53_06115 [Gammaproteobacteria bacterium SG8_11]|nr:MAG: hypothetical protein AMJ53_06115 [Gammaproteobacteria bacterium SG8_11]